jgi:hypothetical protein
MKDALFAAIARIHFKVISQIKNCADLLIAIVTALSNSTLKIIDRDRMNHAQSTVDQYETISELQTLTNIEQVKNDAIKIGEWNEDHETSLNFLGNILCNEHDWEVEQVERYLHDIIAAGPEVNTED